MYNETTRLVKVVMPENVGDGIVSGDSPLLLASAPTADSGAIMLSDTAENLFIAYEVVAMVKDESTGKTHFSQLRWKKLGEIEIDGGDAKSVADPSGDGEQIGVKGTMRDGMGAATEEELPLYYQFMFESGDLFVAAAADEYPALDGDELQMLNDSSSGGGSGGGSTGGGVLVVHANEVEEGTKATTRSGEVSEENTSYRLDRTWQEIYDADFAVLKLYGLTNSVETAYVANVGAPTEGIYFVVFYGFNDGVLIPLNFVTDSPDGYPVMVSDGGGASSQP